MNAVAQPQHGYIEIVPFTDEYADQIIPVCREMWAESIAHSRLPVNEAKLISQLKNSRTNPDLYFRLAVLNGEVVGGFFGSMTTIFFSGERAARDLAWYVKKEMRFSRAALLLVTDWKRWGASRGANTFMLGQSTGISPHLTRLLYEKLGFVVVGSNSISVTP